jgi:membrane fusion protein (multidrug efflux system)
MAVIEDDVWVLANLKETQLERVQIGQPVQINIDAIPSHPFAGKVDSLQPGSGSNFALLPPDNATGNFIKIVQRVGLSCSVTLQTSEMAGRKSL